MAPLVGARVGGSRVAFLASLPLLALVSAVVPDCSKLYDRKWTSKIINQTQGGTEYGWEFNPCTPAPVNGCNQPPYSGNVYVSQINREGAPNPCAHQLFCEARPQSVTRMANNDVVYTFIGCVPSWTGTGPSSRSATVTVSCDSETLTLDPVSATRLGNGGYHFTLHYHAPCNNTPPAPQPQPVAPTAPVPSDCTMFTNTPTDFFTLPLNTSGTEHGKVFYWGFNLCNQVEYNGHSGYFLNQNSETRAILNLDVLESSVPTATGYTFGYSSTHNPNTAVVEVERGAGAACDWLSPPSEGVVGTINGNGGIQFNVIVRCMANGE